MKAIMTLESGYKAIIDFLTPPTTQKIRDTSGVRKPHYHRNQPVSAKCCQQSRKATYPKALRLPAASILF